MDWQSRYTQQARWTHDLRRYLFEKAGLGQARQVLEVGCGPGVITHEVAQISSARVYGLDIDLPALRQAASHDGKSAYVSGNALALPFPDNCFDATFCHFLLLWVSNPQAAVQEMARITRPGGAVLAMAEPDYGGRIDYPAELVELGRLQGVALQQQGADPLAGRKLAGWFHRAALRDGENGVLGGQWGAAPTEETQEMDWQVLEADLAGLVSPERLADLRRIDSAAWSKGVRVLFVPTFYAWGKKEPGKN